MNKTKCKVSTCCEEETQENGTETSHKSKKSIKEQQIDSSISINQVKHSKLKSNSNGLVVNGIRQEKNQPIPKKTDNGTHEIDHSQNSQILDDEVAKSSKKSKGKKRNKTTAIQSTQQTSECAEPANVRTTLPDDFDIVSIIHNKYKEENEGVEEVFEDMTKLRVEEASSTISSEEPKVENPKIEYVAYESELQMPLIMKIIQKDLSEPYSIYTYRYFIHNWPNLCFLAMCEEECVGAIVCKLDIHRKVIKRGYIAMLAVDKRFRKNGLGSTLVKKAIQEMISGEADEVVLETEITNKPALRLYEALGFVRDKRLFRYYLNGVDALRLKLWLR